MSKKVYCLVVALTQAAGIAASAIISHFQPPYYGAWLGVVEVATAGVDAACLPFVKTEK